MFTNNNEDRVTSLTPFWCLYYYFETYFANCSSVSIAEFEQVNAGWVISFHTTLKCKYAMKATNLFHAYGLFLYPLKTTRRGFLMFSGGEQRVD